MRLSDSLNNLLKAPKPFPDVVFHGRSLPKLRIGKNYWYSRIDRNPFF